jgi:Fe-S oxidoreductase
MANTAVSHNLSASEEFFGSLYELSDGERVKACLQCGTCSGVCPFGYLMDFPPSRLIAALRSETFDKVLQTDSIWMCVSCYACSEVCPAQIPLTLALMTRAKEELLLAGQLPAELQEALENSHRYGNPLGESPRKRAEWTKNSDLEIKIMRQERRPVDVLWYVGDYASFHPRVQLVTRAFAKIMNALDIDFGILGPEEVSDGDSQRLAGERGLFESLAEKNDRVLSKYQFDQIITTDPHAYNALKNEYPALGFSYPVQHYTQFLVKYLDQLIPLLTQEIKAKVTFHDPCYLGRANGIYEEPRQLLRAIPGIKLVEMRHSRTSSLCCGGGGGGMWLDGFQWEKAHTRLSEWRIREAVTAGADILSISCPYEAPRFEDAIKLTPTANKLVIKDIAELLAEAMGD